MVVTSIITSNVSVLTPELKSAVDKLDIKQQKTRFNYTLLQDTHFSYKNKNSLKGKHRDIQDCY